MIVFITGATAGFGAALARRFIQDGSKVIATGRREDRLDQLRTELGDNLHPLVLDVRDRKAVENAFASLPADTPAILDRHSDEETRDIRRILASRRLG